jgi:hypothetical protein
MTGEARTAVARRAATARWVRRRFGASRFKALGMPGGELVDDGLSDLAYGKVTIPSLLVSLASARLRREGVPVGAVHQRPEEQLYRMLARSSGDLAHARYNAYRRQLVSFADACRRARFDGGPGAS